MSAALRAKRSLGQNFLVDRGAATRIVEAAAAAPGLPLLEIGPGRGALTGMLIDRAGKIAAVERDERLADALESEFGAQRLLLYRGDVLDLALGEVAAALGTAGGGEAGGLVVVGNLPYNISKPVSMKLVNERGAIARAVLMFQREVAERLVATAGNKRYGPLSVLAGRAFRIRRLFDLRPGAFRPQPKVDSSVTLWERRAAADLDPRIEPALRACLAASFARRRATLRNNLRRALGSDASADDLLARAGLDGALRAEALTPESFLQLARLWPPAV